MTVSTTERSGSLRSVAGLPEERLGRCLRELREEHGWTQHQLARRVGITNCQVSRFEAGKQQPMLKTLLRLGRALGLGAGPLLARADPCGPEAELLDAWSRLPVSGRQIVLPLLRELPATLSTGTPAELQLVSRLAVFEPARGIEAASGLLSAPGPFQDDQQES